MAVSQQAVAENNESTSLEAVASNLKKTNI